MPGPQESGVVMPGRGAMRISYQPGQGGEGRQAGPGQPHFCSKEAMLAAGCQGRKTNQRSIFKFSRGHYPRSQEGSRGWWEGRKQSWGGCWERAGVDRGRGAQRGKALIRSPASEARAPAGSPTPCSPTPTQLRASNIQASFAPACCSNNNHWERQQGHGLFETLLLTCSRDNPSTHQVLARSSHHPPGEPGRLGAPREAPKALTFKG